MSLKCSVVQENRLWRWPASCHEHGSKNRRTNSKEDYKSTPFHYKVASVLWTLHATTRTEMLSLLCILTVHERQMLTQFLALGHWEPITTGKQSKECSVLLLHVKFTNHSHGRERKDKRETPKDIFASLISTYMLHPHPNHRSSPNAVIPKALSCMFLLRLDWSLRLWLTWLL